MSASLVGSEMCIRDRPPAACHRPFQALFGAVQRCAARHIPASYVAEELSPYTHLTLPTICSV
eukprot:8991275-Alexandrium_andersonii.AAC.1